MLRNLFASWKISGLVAIAMIAATLFVHQLVINQQHARIISDTDFIASSFAARLQAHLDVRFGVANTLKSEWERHRIDSLDDFRVEAMGVHELFDDLQALNWVSPEGIIEVITPTEGNEAALGLNIRALPAPSVALREAERTGEVKVTPPITLAQGGAGFVAYIAMRDGQQSLGALNIVFRADPLFESAAGDLDVGSYNVWVRDGDQPLWGGQPPAPDAPYLLGKTIDTGGRTWTILSQPTATRIAATGSWVDEIILVSGVLAALVTAVLVHLAVTQQRSLRESEERFSYAMRGANDGLWDWDLETGKTYFSPRWYEMLGYAPGELPYRHDTFLSLLHPDDRSNITAYPMDMIARNSDALESDFRMRHKNGEWRNVLSRAFLVREKGKVVRIVGTHVDITELRENEQALKRAQEILREGLEALPVGFAYYGADHALLEFNSNYAALLTSQTRYLEPGQRFDDLVGESTAFAASRKEVLDGEMGARDAESLVYQRADGRWIEARERKTSSGGFIHVLEDVTEMRRHQERMRQTQKMEAIGQLTGGIAHDFNNLLAVIMGNAELLEELHGDATAITSAIVHATQRGAELTQRLLAFSRKQPLSPESVDLPELISGMLELLEPTLGENINIQTAVPDRLWKALADPGQVENAVLNLALNARDAMPAGGVVTIECANVHLSETMGPDGEEITAGDYVALSVRDHGVGMSKQVRDHAFEPFFTTKGVGEGSGLGLSMVYGFAQQSGGLARIESVEGQGTTIKLYLPRAATRGKDKPAPVRARMRKGHGETILVIEDDADLRPLIQTMLEGLGYTVLTASDATAAKRRVRGNNDIRLVLSDVVLPGGQSGPDLAAELNESHPHLRVVFMSGYPADENGADGRAAVQGNLLTKPFTIETLADALGLALSA